MKRARTGDVLAAIPAEAPAEVQRATFKSACAGIDPDDRRLVLVVAGTSVLQRRLLMPLAAAADPRKVVGYELDRQTPFKPDQLYYNVRVSTAAAPAGQVALDLYAAPRAELTQCATELARRIAGLPAAALSTSKACIAAAQQPGRGGFTDELDFTRSLLTNTETRQRVTAFLAGADDASKQTIKRTAR